MIPGQKTKEEKQNTQRSKNKQHKRYRKQNNFLEVEKVDSQLSGKMQ